jgi:branched-chain amino acid transport system substrate-binding protein
MGWKMHIKRRGLLVGSAATAGLLAWQGSGRIARATEPLRFGLTAPLSGVSQLVGQAVRVGAEIARDQINNEGGIGGRQIELLVEDDKGVATNAVAAANEFIGKGVNLLLGSPLTVTSMALEGVLPQMKGVLIGCGAGGDNLTHELFTRNYFSAADNSFTRTTGAAAIVAKNNPDVTRWTAIVVDLAVGHQQWDAFAASLRKYYSQIAHKDIEILQPAFAKIGTTDFKPQISQLLNQNATGIFATMTGSDQITFFQQAAAFGIRDKIQVAVDATTELDLARAVGANLPKTFWSITYWYYEGQKGNPMNDAFAAAARARTGDPTGGHSVSALAHTALHAYAAAIKTVGTTETDPIINGLETININSVRGPFHFRKEDHIGICSIDYIRIGAKASAPGWQIVDVVHESTAGIVNPPAPGVPLKL